MAEIGWQMVASRLIGHAPSVRGAPSYACAPHALTGGVQKL